MRPKNFSRPNYSANRTTAHQAWRAGGYDWHLRERKKMDSIRRGICPKCHGSWGGFIFKCSACGGTGRYHRWVL